MESRRDFIKKASLLAGGAGVWSMLPASIQKAMAIDPAVGSTYLDAEHIVFLMQENRSFDHTYGTLQGVRGFNDPRAMILPNRNAVWLQTDKDGNTYAPFRLDIKNTKATWMSSLPHSWTNQVDARNEGHYDKWLHVKQPWQDDYKKIPMTMGYYNREDIPFYYSLADAFTVCDQNFCSSLTGTTPNRLYFWSGTIRGTNDDTVQANVWNEDADYDTMVSWKTYPERLEENEVTWKVYQNDISVDGGYTGEQDEWMSNFGDNPLEYFTQYNVKLSERYINYLKKAQVELPKEIATLEDVVHSSSAKNEESEQQKKRLAEAKDRLEKVKKEATIYTREKYEALSAREKAIHEKAFCNNRNDPHFYELETLTYNDNGTQREVKVPKGDVLYQFREDVNNGKLPTVSWLVAPETFSDHPSSAWYGAWYVSEVMDILTKNPEVWKKTIFILTYDENDGYYDHASPFTAPNPKEPMTGKTSKGIDTSIDFVTLEQERKRADAKEEYLRESSIGLGYRVPLVIASPWSRGGWVNSEVFDHTSSLQFLEEFLEKKYGKKIQETNISTWRRAVCGNLTSAFRKYDGKQVEVKFVKRDEFVESIHEAKFKEVPDNYKKIPIEEQRALIDHPGRHPLIPVQEKGIRNACALPYELYVDGNVSEDGKGFDIHFSAGKAVFGKKSAGAPFTVHARGYKANALLHQAYATEAGDSVSEEWSFSDFNNDQYHLTVYGPNGFYRLFWGSAKSKNIEVTITYQDNTAVATIVNKSGAPQTVMMMDEAYGNTTQKKVIAADKTETILIDTVKSNGWYDFTVMLNDGDKDFGKRYAGRIETGKESKTDPVMGRMV